MFKSQAELLRAILSGDEVEHIESGSIYFLEKEKDRIVFKIGKNSDLIVSAHINFSSFAEFKPYVEPIEFESAVEFFEDSEDQIISVNIDASLFSKLKNGNYKITMVRS